MGQHIIGRKSNNCIGKGNNNNNGFFMMKYVSKITPIKTIEKVNTTQKQWLCPGVNGFKHIAEIKNSVIGTQTN